MLSQNLALGFFSAILYRRHFFCNIIFTVTVYAKIFYPENWILCQKTDKSAISLIEKTQILWRVSLKKMLIAREKSFKQAAANQNLSFYVEWKIENVSRFSHMMQYCFLTSEGIFVSFRREKNIWVWKQFIWLFWKLVMHEWLSWLSRSFHTSYVL